jgi:GNAT superfamily N-acetyltransferase
MPARIVETTVISTPAERRPGTVRAPEEGFLVRATVPGDVQRLDRMFSRCSTETIRLRFHLPFPRVPRGMLDRLANMDPALGKAIVAGVGDEVVGHAMYAREEEGDREAEVAVVVEDGWSSRGVGRLLLAEISAEAKRGSVETLTCATLADNRRLLDLARRAFPGARLGFSGGACSMRLPLGRVADGAPTTGGASEEVPS